MDGTEILEVVRQIRKLQLKAEFQHLAHVPRLLGRSVQRVWSTFVTLCRGGALLCDEKVLRRCTWLEKMVRQSLDQLDLLHHPCFIFLECLYHVVYTCAYCYLPLVDKSTSLSSLVVGVLLTLSCLCFRSNLTLSNSYSWELNSNNC